MNPITRYLARRRIRREIREHRKQQAFFEGEAQLYKERAILSGIDGNKGLARAQRQFVIHFRSKARKELAAIKELTLKLKDPLL